METIAVYFEPVAKSYGVHAVTGMVMAQVRLDLEAAAPGGLPTPAPAPPAGKFAFVMLQCEPGEAAVLSAVARPEEISAILPAFMPFVEAGGPRPSLLPVEMVLFQGPHFYERYGIAAAALDKLREKEVGLLLAGFSGSMAYLVVPEGAAESAKAALAECFHLP